MFFAKRAFVKVFPWRAGDNQRAFGKVLAWIIGDTSSPRIRCSRKELEIPGWSKVAFSCRGTLGAYGNVFQREREIPQGPGIRCSHPERKIPQGLGIRCSHPEQKKPHGLGIRCSYREWEIPRGPGIRCSHGETESPEGLG